MTKIADHHYHAWIPGRPEGASGPYERHFLFQIGDVFIMDNHGLALWCYRHWKNLHPQEPDCHLLHIDAHEDYQDELLQDEMSAEILWNAVPTDLSTFLHTQEEKYRSPLYRWDNYLPIMFNQFGRRVGATYGLGKKAPWDQRLGPEQLLRDLSKLFVDDRRWIINIDADYFYPLGSEHKTTTLYHPDWISAFFMQLKAHHVAGDIAGVYFAFSPECCGSWENSLRLWKMFESAWGLPAKFDY
jgi:hypothetical protein